MMSEKRLPSNPIDVIRPLHVNGNGNVGVHVVAGDSMMPTVADGDAVVFARTEYAHDGNIIIAEVDGQRIIKRVVFRHDEILLKSDNPKYPTMHCQHDEVRIIGVCLKFVRDLKC